LSLYMGTTPQPIPQVGDTYYDVVSNVLRIYDGLLWATVTANTSEELLWNMCVVISFEKEQGTYEQR